MYRCFTCGQHTNTMHEFFYNGKANKPTCINYKLQIPVCGGSSECHRYFHNNKKLGQKKLCEKFNLPYEQLNITMNKPVKKWGEFDSVMMARIRDHMEKILERYEV